MKALNANPGETYANANIWFTFTTRVGTYPGDFSKQYPLEFAVDIPTNPTLQWAASSNATRYEYCYDNVVNGACTTWVNNGTSRQVTISTPELNKQYEWHVRAWNDTEGPTYSNSLLDSFWTFTTVKVNPPTPFGKTSPASGTTGLLPPDLALTWGASTNVSTYEYCYDTVRNNTCDSEWTSTIDTGVDISDLVFGKQYEWQVRAFRDDNPNPTPADGGTWWTFATVATQPGAFNKSEPINLAVDRPIALTLVWGASTGAASYEYCVEPYDGNDTCEGDNWLSPVPVTNNNVNISGLSYGTKYSWQVRAVNANPTMTYANAGAWYQFTTAIAPPGAFSKISPANGAVNQLLSLVLSWQASPGATSYAYCYDATVNSSCSGTWTATTATSASISGLNYATGYEWHVRATNLTGTTYSNSNTLWTFTTVDNPAGAFSKTNPVAGASGQPIDPTLTWEESSGAIEYQYCIDTTPDSVCDGDAWVSSGTLRIADLTGLAYLTTYQWQVRAKSDNPNWTQANSGTWRLFTTQVSPPDPFDKISPAHEAPNQPNRPYLSWGASNGATGYAYCIDTTLNGGCDGSWVPTSLLYAYVSSPELAYGTPYEWQVKAINDTGETEANEGDSPEWWTFTVKAEPTNSKANPDDGYFNQPVDLEINWTSMSDVEYYEYCYDASVNDACLDESWTATPGLTTYANLTGLINGETYEWQVRGYDEDTTSYFYANSGEWWTFSIVQTAPGDFSKSSPSHPSSGQPANDLTLSWDTSSDATGYRYCLDTNQNETCNTSWVTVGSGTTSVDVSNLVYGANYEWQVLASNNNPNMTEANDDETPEWWTFTVINAPPEPFNKLTPADNALDQLINLNLSWQAAVGATSGYQYCIDDTLDSTCDGDAWLPATPPSNTTVAISALENDTPYEWQVRAYSANSYEPTLANGGNWHTFTTVVSSPQDFNKISPATGITWLPTELMISWEESPGATGYEYCVDDQPGNAACDGVWLETSLTQALISGLINQTEYEWHVRAVNANPVITESDSGSWFNFSTIPLHSYLPVLLKAPLRPPVLNPVTIGPGNTYTLTWSADAQATSFKIWESLTTTFPTDPTYETTTASLPLPANKNPTRYYYYVIASAGTKSSLPSNILAVDRQYELEDNDSSPTANGQIFTNVEYHGHPDDQKDYYKFYMSGSGTITVTMTDFPTSWPGQLQLLDDSLRALSWDVNPYDGMKVTLYSATAKWYYIYIATDPSGYSSNWYDFTVTVTH
ncbi:MAG: hypothetical protein JW704_00800 [Anaerolineaceae bacterium]|nr:hypothetical protein [Anaerolineaceae bacterium]